MSYLETRDPDKSAEAQARGNIVALGDRMRAGWCTPLRQVEAYWTAQRAGRVVPARSDIDPRGIEGALEFSFIAERIAPDHARIRIAGTHLCDLMGMEVRGMPLSALLSPVSRATLGQMIRAAFDAPARIELSLLAERRIGKPELAGRLLLLPMSDDFGDISRILGCLVSDGTIGRAPRRFDITQHNRVDLRPEGHAFASPSAQRPRAVAEAPRRFEPGPVPYLKVVKDDH